MNARPTTAEILLAEDSPTQARQVSEMLERAGYAVAAAPNGAEALTLARAHRPDVVLTDVLMPEMDGYALCRAIKSDADLSEIPVILLTSLGSPNDVIRGLECGADNFIRKPCDEGQLVDRIASILMSRRLRRGARAELGVELLLSGKRHMITSERQQILDFLLSSYEEVAQAHELLEVKRAELEDALADLRSVLEASPDGIIMSDLGGTLRVVNGAAERLMSEILGHPARLMYHVSTLDEVATLLADRTTDPEACARNFAALRERPDLTADDEYELVQPSRHLLCHSSPVRSSTYQMIGRIVLLRDITSEREAERLKSELVATVAHELRTPLANVLGFAELLGAKSEVDDAERGSYLDTIRSEGKRLIALINDFLDLQRIEAGGFAPSIHLVDVRALVREAVHPFASHQNGHTLDLVLPEEPLTVHADTDRITRVVSNLVSNALKYSPDGGPITVRADRARQAVRLSVTDSGLGIPTDRQPEIFDRFVRAHTSTRPDITGTGLGLALCKEIVDAHGGTIAFDSTEGHGSTFWFELPAAETPPPADERSRTSRA